jgi:integrase
MPLTDKAVRNTKPGDRPIKLFDGGGLFLIVAPAGGKWWRFKYRFARKEKLISLGTYPDVGLKEARDRRDTARKQLASGIDPSIARKATKAAFSDRASNSFEMVAREWLAKFSPRWTPTHIDNITRRLEKNLFPWIGSRPIDEVGAPELLTVLRRIENRGAIETAHRAQQNCSQIFRYAIATGRAERDPSIDLRGALAPVKEKHLAAITEPKTVGRLLRGIDAYEGSFVTKCALRLAPLVFVRPGELRHAEWTEIDLDQAEWNIPSIRMKLREPHLVPLSKQSLQILNEIKPLTGAGRYVFPGARSSKRPMSENTIVAALRNMGFAKNEMSGHGFRAMARTILDEVLHVRPDYIEHQLAHSVLDPNGRAYNRTTHLDERRKMMQQWADYLDQLKSDFS